MPFKGGRNTPKKPQESFLKNEHKTAIFRPTLASVKTLSCATGSCDCKVVLAQKSTMRKLNNRLYSHFFSSVHNKKVFTQSSHVTR